MQKLGSLRKFAYYLTYVIAVILASTSLTAILVNKQVTSPDFYTEALNNSGIYSQITGIIEDYTSYAIKKKASEKIEEKQEEHQDNVGYAIGELLDNMVENNTNTFVSTLSDSINLEGGIQNIANNSINYSISWMLSEEDETGILHYIPSTEELEDLQNSDIVSLLTRIVIKSIYRVSDLPECTSIEEEKQNLEILLDSGKIRDITCTSSKIEEASSSYLYSRIPEDIINNLNNSIENSLEENNITPVLDNIYSILYKIAQLKEFTSAVRTEIRAMLLAPYVLFSFSLILIIITIVLAERGKRFITMSSIFIVMGVLLLSTSLLFNIFEKDLIIAQLHLDEVSIANDIITPAREALFVQSLEQLANNLLDNVNYYVVRAGIILTLIGFTLAIIWHIRSYHTKDFKGTYKFIKDKLHKSKDSLKNRINSVRKFK